MENITEERISELERQDNKLRDALYWYFRDEGTTMAVTIAALCADWRARQKRDELKELDFCLLVMEAKFAVIHKTADDARKAHSVQGHHCELRAAIDSICDRSSEGFEETRTASQFYNTFEHSEMERLRREVSELRKTLAHCVQEPVAALESPKTGQDSGIDPTKTIYPSPASLVRLIVHRRLALERFRDQPLDIVDQRLQLRVAGARLHAGHADVQLADLLGRATADNRNVE